MLGVASFGRSESWIIIIIIIFRGGRLLERRQIQRWRPDDCRTAGGRRVWLNEGYQYRIMQTAETNRRGFGRDRP